MLDMWLKKNDKNKKLYEVFWFCATHLKPLFFDRRKNEFWKEKENG